VLGAGLKLGKLNGADLGAVAFSSGLEVGVTPVTVGGINAGLSASLVVDESLAEGVVSGSCVVPNENGDFVGASATGAADDGAGLLLLGTKLVNAGVGAAVPFVEGVLERKLKVPGCADC
jgi:hypothetical protein